MIKGVTRAIFGPIWYYSDPSPNQFLRWDFFGRFLQQDGSSVPNRSAGAGPNKRADTGEIWEFFIKINKRACISIRYTRASPL